MLAAVATDLPHLGLRLPLGSVISFVLPAAAGHSRRAHDLLTVAFD